MEQLMQLALSRCNLGEGPLWHRETGEFVFTDITAGTLWAWNPCGGAPRKLLCCEMQLGAFLFAADGSLVLFTEAGVFHCPYGGARSDFRLLWQVPMTPGERFNDAICDPAGRMLAGTLTPQEKDGALWRFCPGRAPELLFSGLGISNGMGFSPDGKIFYHTDSARKTILCYCYDSSDGALFAARRAVQFADDDRAVPDGMTIDSEGMLWTACWGAGCIRRYVPEQNRLLEQIALPGIQVSSLTFGGSALKTILVTSAGCGGAPAPSGGIWAFSGKVVGREEYRARLGAGMETTKA